MVAANFRSAIGLKFGMLTVLEEGYGKKRRVIVRCDCGVTKSVMLNTLRNGSTKSCGCLRVSQLRKHGHCKHPLFRCWADMLRRCKSSGCKAYKHYGGRGIKVCERWHEFENFVKDMGDKPDGGELDRINNDGDYCPENCKWSTRTEQLRNQRRSTAIEIDGATKTLSEWALFYGVVSPAVASGRIHYGWDAVRAFTTPVRGSK